MPRIIAGSAKGLRLKSPPGYAARPSSARLKEAFFSIVQNELRGARFLDIYAGSGQMALEAISRGAHAAVLIEKDKRCFRIMQANIALCRFEEQARAILGDATLVATQLIRAQQTFDLIYLDPPWEQATRLLQEIDPYLLQLKSADGKIILEWDEQLSDMPKSLSLLPFRTCHYGRSMLSFYQ